MPGRLMLFALGCSLLLLAGCGGGGTVVKGQVLFEGQPLAGARVKLESGKKSTGFGAYGATTDEKGNFEIRSLGPKSIKPGSYLITVTKYVDKKGAAPSAEDYEQMLARGDLKSAIPLAYTDTDSTPLFADIKEGENVLPPLQLSKKVKR